MAQYVNIKEYWKYTPFHCPACGEMVFGSDGEMPDPPCDHLLFSWLECHPFLYLYNASEELSRAALDIENPEIPESVPSDFSTKKFLDKCPKNTVLFSFEETEIIGGGAAPLLFIHAIEFEEYRAGRTTQGTSLGPNASTAASQCDGSGVE